MRVIGQSLKYLFRNFHIVGLFALPMAVAFALKFNQSSFFEYLIDLSTGQNKTLGEIYGNFSLLPVYSLGLSLLWAAVVVLSFCLLFSYVERHMNYGIRNILRCFRSINFTVLTVVPAFLVIVGVEELFAFFSALFINLFSLSQSPLMPVVLPSIYLFMTFILFMVYALFALWIPIRMATGYTNRDAIRYSIRLSQGRQMSIMFGLVFPMLVTSPVMLLLHSFSNVHAVNIIFYAVCYIFIAGYYVSYTMTLYYYVTGKERKDIKPSLFKRK